MSFEPVKRILARSLPSSPMATELQIARVFEAWQQTLIEGWGTDRAVFVTPVSFSHGVLKLETTSPSAKQTLALDLPRFKNDLNRRLGAFIVRSVSVVQKGF